MLAKLDVYASIGKAELLKTISSPSMALAFCLLILLSTQISQAPFVVCSTRTKVSLSVDVTVEMCISAGKVRGKTLATREYGP